MTLDVMAELVRIEREGSNLKGRLLRIRFSLIAVSYVVSILLRDPPERCETGFSTMPRVDFMVGSFFEAVRN